jgi:hypothetical protein
MRPLEHKKLLTLIAPHEFQRLLVDTLRKREVGGYTIVEATGAGASGVRSGGPLACDSNVLIYVIISEGRLQLVLEDLDALMRGGYRFKAMFSDITILPRKPTAGSEP